MTAGDNISPLDFCAASYKTNKQVNKKKLGTNVFEGIQIRSTMKKISFEGRGEGD